MTAFRNSLIDDVIVKVNELNKDNFAVKQHLRYVEKFSSKDSFAALTPLDIQQLTEEIEPLVLPFEDEINAVRFDALMYAIELAEIIGQRYTRGIKDLMGKVRAVSTISTIPEALAQKDFINQILNTSYVDNAGINEFELIRIKIRELVKYIPYGPKKLFETDITDDILSLEFHESDLENDDLQNYRMKVNYYIRQHMDNDVIAKLHTNQPLTKDDISELEKILWSELGTKDDYIKEYNDKPLGELVREIVGLDMNAANTAFSKYLDNVNLDDKQIYFVKQIINYIVKNGMMTDFSVMQESPFTDKGTLSEVFTDMTIWLDIKNIIKSINSNAAA